MVCLSQHENIWKEPTLSSLVPVLKQYSYGVLQYSIKITTLNETLLQSMSHSRMTLEHLPALLFIEPICWL